ncbi:MAG: rhodanese-like domain-containing protein [Planctomycetota bacterium]
MSQFPLEVDVQEVKNLLDKNEDFVLLDCRETNEFEFVSINGSTLIPMSEIQQRVEELNDHKNAHIVVHCHHGGRSLQVANWLRMQGFERTQSMAGGIDSWSTQIDPSLPRY